VPADDTVTTVADRYRLDTVIGSGGVGRVWRGEDTVLRRPVAIKEVPLPTHLPDAERGSLRERVLREARAAARIHHPGSVQVFDVIDEADQVYLIMELVEDQTLAEVVTATGPLSPRAAAAMGVELLGALEAAHKVGIVHRDVKPRNVMVTTTGGVKLADFGIAWMRDDPSITKTGMVLGTPSYMSPEQALGEAAGPPSDLWSTGALLYYAVEGQAPFDQGEPISTLHAVVHGEPRPFERAGPLAPVINGLLAKDPTARLGLPDAKARLTAIAGGAAPDDGATTAMAATRAAPITATTVAPPLSPVGEVRRPPMGPPVRTAAGSPPRRLPLAALLAVVALLAVGGIVLAQQGGDGGGAGTEASGEAAPTTVAPTAPTTTAPPAGETEASTEDATTTTEAPAKEATDRPAGVPDSWTSYTEPSVGWTIWHPTDWAPTPTGGNAVDVKGPDGAYLRVDYVQPPGDDAVAAWERSSASFAERYPDYEEIRIDAVTYQGYEAALWEYTYEGQRATNLGIIADDIDTGFALNFQTTAERWDELQDVREAFDAGFTIPG